MRWSKNYMDATRLLSTLIHLIHLTLEFSQSHSLTSNALSRSDSFSTQIRPICCPLVRTVELPEGVVLSRRFQRD